MINGLSDYQSQIIIRNPGLNREYSGDNARLMETLGNFRFTGMEDALRKMIIFYGEILPNIDREAIEKDPYASKCKINNEPINT
jgi:GDP-L-fucose synthase